MSEVQHILPGFQPESDKFGSKSIYEIRTSYIKEEDVVFIATMKVFLGSVLEKKSQFV